MKGLTIFGRFVLALIAGIIVYVIGFFVGVLIGYITSVFQLWLPGGKGSITTIQLTAGAIASNLAATVIFSLIYGDENMHNHPFFKWLFLILLMLVAIAYGILQALSGVWAGIWFAVVSCGICIWSGIESK